MKGDVGVQAAVSLEALIDRELRQPVQPEAMAFADVLRARFGDAMRAVLFYGSCLRSRDAAGVLDFYVLVDSYRPLYRARISALFNRLLPPNVYFLSTATMPAVAAKVAVISLDQFARRMHAQSLDTTLWARFAQPAALVYAADDEVRRKIIAALLSANATAVAWARRFAPDAANPRTLWATLFWNTYNAELRTERGSRGVQVYDTDPERYETVTEALAATPPARGAWALRRVAGKLLSVLRLTKAAFTFSGAADYVAYKLERHTGVPLELTPWQRRHPLLAAPVLLARLYGAGLIR